MPVCLASVICLSLLLTSGAFVEANAAAPPDSGPVFWKFDSLLKYFRNSNGHLMIAGLHDGRTYLLDPATMKVVSGDPSQVARQFQEWSQFNSSAIELQGGGSLHVDVVDDCSAPSYSDPPLVIYSRSDQAVTSFYVIARRTPPEVVEQLSPTARDCRDFDGRTVTARQFGSPLGGDIFPLPDHRLLLAGFYGGLIARLPGLPSSVISIGDDIFLVPRQIVERGLAKAGYPNARRYQVFLAAIRQAQSATPLKLLSDHP